MNIGLNRLAQAAYAAVQDRELALKVVGALADEYTGESSVLLDAAMALAEPAELEITDPCRFFTPVCYRLQMPRTRVYLRAADGSLVTSIVAFYRPIGGGTPYFEDFQEVRWPINEVKAFRKGRWMP